jgi:hypothetical protein
MPTLREFMRDAMGRLVAFDGRLWRSLYGLVCRPGFLTKEYFAGRRRRYIRPARLFLVMSLLLFGVVGFVESPGDLGEIVVTKSDLPGTAKDGPGAAVPDASSVDPGAPREKDSALSERRAKAIARAKAKEAARSAEGDERFTIGVDDDLNLTIAGVEKALPPVLRQRFVRFKELPRQEKAERLYAGLLRYGPYAMFVLLPAFALMQKIAYLGRARRYPDRPRFYSEHLVYSAHLHAFAFLMVMLFVLVPFGLVRAAVVLWVLYYLYRARAVVYGGRWWAGLLRAAVTAIIYAVLVTLAILGLLVAAVMLR